MRTAHEKSNDAMQVSSAIYIVMPTVIMAALFIMCTLPFFMDKYGRQRSRRPLQRDAAQAPMRIAQDRVSARRCLPGRRPTPLLAKRKA